MRIWKKVTVGILAVLVAIVLSAVAIGWLLSSPASEKGLMRSKVSPQYENGKFFNIERQAAFELTGESLRDALANHPGTNPVGEIPVVSIDPSRFNGPASAGLQMAWIGHAGVLIEIDGKRILTDPVFSERASPFSFLGPTRFHRTPIELDDLSGIDAVVITHNHYDHLDKVTVQHLSKQGTRFFVPLGNAAQLEAWGVAAAQIEEMDWWQSAKLGDLQVVATPSRHYSNRGTFDVKETLWASWSIIGPENRVFVSGDSGYSKLFTEIGERFGPFDATIIKIGAYGPGASWLDVHMTPEMSVQVHKDVKGKAMLPVHWGTFNLGYHPWDEPIIRTVGAAYQLDVKLLTPRVGQFVDPKIGAQSPRWWEGIE